MVDEPLVVGGRDRLAVLAQGGGAQRPLAFRAVAAVQRRAAQLGAQAEARAREQRRDGGGFDPEHRADLLV